MPNLQFSEEDVKRLYITPAIESKWDRFTQIKMEAKITDGRINLAGNLVVRQSPKFADYLLSVYPNYPIAVVEAKDQARASSYGLQQAMTYAQMLDIPFAYSSNGIEFVEHDFLTGKERNIPIDQFPSPEELYVRYKNEGNITDNEELMIKQPYYSGQNTYGPRYYQRIAINKTLDAIARGQERLLLVMATGTGKTYTAFQICYRLLRSGVKKKILYLADRNNLVDQSIQQDFRPLEKVIHKVDASKDNKTTLSAYQMYFSLYHQLAGDEGEEKFRDLFNKDFFDLIIIDECHRGSAKEDSRWKKILEYFSSATQIGMTATPKETKYVSNINYFGEPIYTYSLNEGIEDGFLAPFKVTNVTLDISDGWRPYKRQLDAFGNLITDRIYNNKDYDVNITISDRIHQVAKDITNYLKSTDRMQKTIVFCASEDHAEYMRKELVNLNSDMVKENPDYVVRITGSDLYGKSKLKYFTSVSEKYPVIATTSELLSTGTDCKMVKLIVLDKMIGSMTEFKQIIGRGTRVREKEGKLSFMVMDFRNVSRLFADPDWDGPIEIDDDFDPNRPVKPRTGGGDTPPGPEPDPDYKPFVDENGCSVHIINKTVSVYDVDGKLLRQESITDYTKRNIKGEYATLNSFIMTWSKQQKKEEILELFKKKGIDFNALKKDQNMEDVDDYDFICYIAYGQKPLTRQERANNVKKRDFFSKYSGIAKEVLETLLEQYMNNGIYEIEKTDVLKLNSFAKYGKPSKIASYFGGRTGYINAVRELQSEIYRTRV